MQMLINDEAEAVSIQHDTSAVECWLIALFLVELSNSENMIYGNVNFSTAKLKVWTRNSAIQV